MHLAAFSAGQCTLESCRDRFPQLATAFSGESTGVVIYGLNAGEFPVTLTVEDNVVTAITQVYLP